MNMSSITAHDGAQAAARPRLTFRQAVAVIVTAFLVAVGVLMGGSAFVDEAADHGASVARSTEVVAVTTSQSTSEERTATTRSRTV